MPGESGEELLVSILVMNWNGRHLLEKYMPSIVANLFEGVEIIVLDCASADGSGAFLAQTFPQVRVISFDRDPNTDRAFNYGVKSARGRYVVLMSNDVRLEPQTISRMLKVQMGHEGAIVIPTEVNRGGVVSQWEKAYPYIVPVYVLAKALGWARRTEGSPFAQGIGCAMFPKKWLLRVPANEHLGFFEELECFWRFHLLGASVLVADGVKVYHEGAATLASSLKPAYFAGRTVLATHFICLGWPGLALFLPEWFLHCVVRTVRSVWARRWPQLVAFWKGVLSVLRDIRLFWGDRKRVQASRKLTDLEILRVMLASCDYAQSRSGLTLGRWVRHIFSGG